MNKIHRFSHKLVMHLGGVAQNNVVTHRDTIAFIGEIANASAEIAKNPSKLRWKATLYYLDLCGTRSLPIVLAICLLMGLTMGFQSAVQLRKFGTELFVADAVGFATLKEFGPLMVAMIAIGRAGSAFAAEIGAMKNEEEISALLTMGISPIRFLVIPKMIAMLVAMPLLTVFGDAAGLLGGWIVGVGMLHIPAVTYIDRTFDVLSPLVLLLGVLKSIFFAFLIVIIGCWEGFRSQSDSQGVGRAATNAVVKSIFLLVIVDTLLTIIYSLWGY